MEAEEIELLPPTAVQIYGSTNGIVTWLKSDISCPKPAVVVFADLEEMEKVHQLLTNEDDNIGNVTHLFYIGDQEPPEVQEKNYKTLCWTSDSYVVYNLTSSAVPVQEHLMHLWQKLSLEGIAPKELLVYQ